MSSKTIPARDFGKDDPDEREDAQTATTHQAVLILQIAHGVDELAAYRMLVQMSVDGQSSVRAAAAQIIEATRE
jgi:AmiR/NasT family two-component response regulator